MGPFGVFRGPSEACRRGAGGHRHHMQKPAAARHPTIGAMFLTRRVSPPALPETMPMRDVMAKHVSEPRGGQLEHLGRHLEQFSDISFRPGCHLGLSEAPLEPYWAILDARAARRLPVQTQGDGVVGYCGVLKGLCKVCASFFRVLQGRVCRVLRGV